MKRLLSMLLALCMVVSLAAPVVPVHAHASEDSEAVELEEPEVIEPEEPEVIAPEEPEEPEVIEPEEPEVIEPEEPEVIEPEEPEVIEPEEPEVIEPEEPEVIEPEEPEDVEPEEPEVIAPEEPEVVEPEEPGEAEEPDEGGEEFTDPDFGPAPQPAAPDGSNIVNEFVITLSGEKKNEDGSVESFALETLAWNDDRLTVTVGEPALAEDGAWYSTVTIDATAYAQSVIASMEEQGRLFAIPQGATFVKNVTLAWADTVWVVLAENDTTFTLEEQPVQDIVVFEDHSHAGVVYQPLPENITSTPAGAETVDLEAGSYYLTKDFELNKVVNITGGTVNLCLNGHTMTMDNNEIYTQTKISLSDGATLNIYECGANGKGTLALCDWGICGTGTLGLYGGNVTMNETLGINLSNSILNIDGADLTAAVSDSINMTGNSTINMGSGSIAASDWAFKVNGVAHISGGTIRSTGSRGAIVVGDERGVLNITGGTITSTGNMLIDVWLSGKLNLSGGSLSCTGKEITVYQPNQINAAGYSGEALDIGWGDVAVSNGELVEGSVVVQNCADTTKFVADPFGDDGLVLVPSGNDLVLGREAPVADHHEGMTAFDYTNLDWTAGSYYLTEGFKMLGTGSKVTVTGDVTLCLNGCTLEVGARQIEIGSNSSLTICDCNTEAEVGKIRGSSNYSLVYLDDETSTFNLESGMLADRHSAGTINVEAGTVNISGGVISSNADTYATVQMTGGKLNLSGAPEIRQVGGGPAISTAVPGGISAAGYTGSPLNISVTNAFKQGDVIVSNCSSGAFTVTGSKPNYWKDNTLYYGVENAHAHAGAPEDYFTVLTWAGNLSAGKYVLEEDLTSEYGMSISGDVTLCLNGHTLTMNGKNISVDMGDTLTICDCQTGGQVTGTGTVVRVEGGTFNLESGQVSSTSTTYPAVLVEEQFQNKAAGTVRISGGSITGGKYAIKATNNEAGPFSEVYLSGAPSLSGNTAALYQGTGAQIYAASADGQPYTGTEVTIDVDPAMEDGAVVVYNVNDDNQNSFTLVPGDKTMTREGNNLVISGPHIHGSETYEVFDSAAADLAGGNYYLNGDVILSNTVTISGDVTICLNGHTMQLAETKSINVAGAGVLTLCDCEANAAKGTLTGSASILLNVNTGGTLNIRDITVSNPNFIAIEMSKATVNLENAAIDAGDGIAVSGTSGRSSVNITNSTITAKDYCVKTSSGAAADTVTINGGTFTSERDRAIVLDSWHDKLILKGGTFTGKDGGIEFKDMEQIDAQGYNGDPVKLYYTGGVRQAGDIIVKNCTDTAKFTMAPYSGLHLVSNGTNLVLGHTYSYTGADNVITETCSGCEHSATATITAEDADYSGEAVETASVAYSDTWAGGELTIVYENNVEAGTATATITKDSASASVDFTINAVEIIANLLLNRPVTMTGADVNSNGMVLTNVNDGDRTTRLSTVNQTAADLVFEFDLGGAKLIDRVEIYERCDRQYGDVPRIDTISVQVPDGDGWTTVATLNAPYTNVDNNTEHAVITLAAPVLANGELRVITTDNDKRDITIWEIEAYGVDAPSYDVTYNLTNLSHNGAATVVTGQDLTFTLTADTGYELPETITVTVGGETAAFTYDQTTGAVTVPDVTGDVVVTAEGTALPPHIHDDVTYEPLTQTEDDLPQGNYYLSGDLTLTGQLNFTGNTILCLNGKTLDIGTGYWNCLNVPYGADLTIRDCDEGEETGKIAGCNIKTSGSTLRVESGFLTRSDYNGDIITASAHFNTTPITGSKIYISGGKLVNEFTGSEGCIDLAKNGVLEITGGELVSSGTAGCVSINETATGTISGGSIRGQIAVAVYGTGENDTPGKLNITGSPVIEGSGSDIQFNAKEQIDANGYNGDALTIAPRGGAYKPAVLNSGDKIVLNNTDTSKFQMAPYGEEGLVLVSDDTNLVLGTAAPAHVLTKVEAVEPTCKKTGNIEYWTCSHCDTLFADAEGTTETTLEAVTLEKLPHNFGDWIRFDDKQHQRKCQNASVGCYQYEYEDHKWGEGVVDGCTTTYTCTVATCGAKKYEHAHDGLEFKPFNGSYFPYTGNYFLTEDVTLSKALTVGSYDTINLCLNGHKIDGGSLSSVIVVQSGLAQNLTGTLDIWDCEGNTGEICSNGTSGVVTNTGGTLNIHGGKITNTGSGYAVFSKNNGYSDMSVTTISGGIISGDRYAVYSTVNSGKDNVQVNITGGTFTSNYRTVFASRPNINISGGSFTTTSATEPALSMWYAGSVSISGGTFNAPGYAIRTNNKVNGDIPDLYLSGAPVLNGTPAALYQEGDAYIHATDKAGASAYTGAEVTIDVNPELPAGTTVVKTVNDSNQDSFKLVTDGKSLTREGDNLVLGAPHVHNWGDPAWTWTEDFEAAAKFVCADDATHVEEIKAAVTEEVTTPADCTTDGVRTYTATVTLDGVEYTAEKTATIPAIGHDWDEGVLVWAEDHSSATLTFTCRNDDSHVENPEVTVTVSVTDPTCDADGQKTYTATASFDGKPYEETYTEVLNATGHAYGDPEWTWTKDETTGDYQAAAAAECENGHTDSFEASVLKAEVKPADCENAGEIRYTATAEIDGTVHTNVYTVNPPALGHDWKEPVWTWHEETNTFTADFVCKRNPGHVKEDVKAVMTEEALEGKEPTCEKDGEGVYVGTIELDGTTYTTQTEKTHTMPKRGHTYGEKPVFDWNSDNTQASATFTCACGHTVTSKATVTVEVVTAPTCEKDGVGNYTATVQYPTENADAAIMTFAVGDSYTDTKQNVTIPALGHKMNDWHTTKEATCTKKGEEARECQRCDYAEKRELPAPGHDWSDWKVISSRKHERTCKRCGATEVKRFIFGENPKTGDYIMAWGVVMVLSAAAVVTMLMIRKQKFHK